MLSRTLALLLLPLSAITSGVGAPAQATPATVWHPRPASLQAVSFGQAARTSSATAQLPARRTARFWMVGLTWDHGSGSGKATVQVKVHHSGGWTRWLDVPLDDERGTGRDGTVPIWVGRADGVAAQVRTTGSTPSGLQVDLINPGTDPTNAGRYPSAGGPLPTSGDASRTTATGAPAYTPTPRMISRAQWGARRSGNCTPIYGSSTLGAVLHHTDGSNSYTRWQARAIMRGMQLFHMRSRGWCDIGYNFVVDKYGEIFVGRGPDIRAQIRGAHAGNWDVNTYDMGVSMMGNFDQARPSWAMRNAIVRLIGWRLGTNFLPAKGTYWLDGYRFQRIMGHRDVYLSGIRPATATACPGRYGYAWLVSRGGLRDQVAAYIRNYHSVIKTRTLAMGSSVTGTLFRGEYPSVRYGRRADFSKGSLLYDAGPGIHWVPTIIAREFNVFGNERGPLGYPTREQRTDPMNPAQSWQAFQAGAIYVALNATGQPVAYGMTLRLNQAYSARGGMDGWLGAPTSRARTSVVNGHTVDSATFVHGTITYDRTTGATTVTSR